MFISALIASSAGKSNSMLVFPSAAGIAMAGVKMNAVLMRTERIRTIVIDEDRMAKWPLFILVLQYYSPLKYYPGVKR